uniref:Uncharacterized protein n=2 Tax=Ixodes scapularis TaxID=6945 RepID=A0A1S4LI67_IXOSC
KDLKWRESKSKRKGEGKRAEGVRALRLRQTALTMNGIRRKANENKKKKKTG